MEKLLENSVKLKEMSSLSLAFLGDGVFELLVREYLVAQGSCPVKKLHSKAVELVRCQSQARMLKEILIPMMTEEEHDVYIRGRNAKVHHVPKNANPDDYHQSTGFESMFGYLYLKGEIERIKEFFSCIIKNENTNI